MRAFICNPRKLSSKIVTSSTPLLIHKPEVHKSETNLFWKNILALVLGVGVFTMGLNPIDDLQSSLNGQNGLGVTSLTIKYAAMIVGNLFTNTVLIRYLGSKKALVIGALLYAVYIVANIYPTWYTLVPLTLISGFGGALMWTTLGNYLARIAQRYANVTNQNVDGVKALFFGLKGTAGYACAAIGGLASSLLLTTDELVTRTIPHSGSDAAHYKMCGVDYCNEDLNIRDDGNATSSLGQGIQARSIYILCGFCLGAVAIAIIILSLLVDPMPKLGIQETRDEGKSSLWLLLATISLWKNPKQLLLIPISFVYGFQEAFWRVEYTKAYITCGMGIQSIGYLMLCYNLASLASSLMAAFLGRRKTRMIAFLFMATVDTAALISLFFWKPNSDDMFIAFAITGLTGATYGGLSTLLLAFYGVVFSSDLESAYSNLYFWSFFASTLMYSWSFFLCLYVKLIIVMPMVVLGTLGYVAVEYLIDLDSKKLLKN